MVPISSSKDEDSPKLLSMMVFSWTKEVTTSCSKRMVEWMKTDSTSVASCKDETEPSIRITACFSSFSYTSSYPPSRILSATRLILVLTSSSFRMSSVLRSKSIDNCPCTSFSIFSYFPRIASAFCSPGLSTVSLTMLREIFSLIMSRISVVFSVVVSKRERMFESCCTEFFVAFSSFFPEVMCRCLMCMILETAFWYISRTSASEGGFTSLIRGSCAACFFRFL